MKDNTLMAPGTGPLAPAQFKDMKQVADLFHVTPRTVQNWIAEEDENLRLEGVFLGKWLFSDNDIIDFINRRRQYGGPKPSHRAGKKREELTETSAEFPAVKLGRKEKQAH